MKFLYNIQLFNDANEGNGENTPVQNDTLTQEQVNDIVSRRLAKEKAKWEKEYNKKLEVEKAEALRLAEMDAEQRKEEEFNKRLKALEERESEIRTNELKIETIKCLQDRNLPQQFVDLVLSNDSETTLSKINLLDKLFQSSIKAEVENRIPTYKPSNGVSSNGQMTKEEFRALPLSKQNELYMSDKELYKNYF